MLTNKIAKSFKIKDKLLFNPENLVENKDVKNDSFIYEKTEDKVVYTNEIGDKVEYSIEKIDWKKVKKRKRKQKDGN